MIYERQRGETIVIAVYDTGAEPGDEPKVTAALKPVHPGTSEPAPLSVVARTFTTNFRPADGSYGKGWDFELPAAQTADLLPGTYQFDICVELSPGDPVISPAHYVKLKEPASL